MTVGEHRASLPPHRPLDRCDSGTWIVLAGHARTELADQAVLRRLTKLIAADVELEGRRRRLVSRAHGNERQWHRDCDHCRGRQEKAGGPPRRAARTFLLLLPYLISNFALPVVWLPAMSVASQRNSVVVLTTNDWPGSRGPVDSQRVEVLFGFEPSVV